MQFERLRKVKKQTRAKEGCMTARQVERGVIIEWNGRELRIKKEAEKTWIHFLKRSRQQAFLDTFKEENANQNAFDNSHETGE